MMIIVMHITELVAGRCGGDVVSVSACEIFCFHAARRLYRKNYFVQSGTIFGEASFLVQWKDTCLT